MAARNRAWRRRKARTEHAKEEATKSLLMVHTSESKANERPHDAQKTRVWWATEQELREAA